MAGSHLSPSPELPFPAANFPLLLVLSSNLSLLPELSFVTFPSSWHTNPHSPQDTFCPVTWVITPAQNIFFSVTCYLCDKKSFSVTRYCLWWKAFYNIGYHFMTRSLLSVLTSYHSWLNFFSLLSDHFMTEQSFSITYDKLPCFFIAWHLGLGNFLLSADLSFMSETLFLCHLNH